MKILNNQTVILNDVRFSYLNIFKPRENALSKTVEYSAVILIDKNSPEVEPLIEYSLSLLREAFNPIPKTWNNGLNSILRDGDTELDSDETTPKYPGYYFFNAKSDIAHPPALSDSEGTVVTPYSGWVSGDIGMVKIRLYTFSKGKTERGIGIGLGAIVFTEKGEPLGDPVNTLDGFDLA